MTSQPDCYCKIEAQIVCDGPHQLNVKTEKPPSALGSFLDVADTGTCRQRATPP